MTPSRYAFDIRHVPSGKSACRWANGVDKLVWGLTYNSRAYGSGESIESRAVIQTSRMPVSHTGD